MYKFIIFTLCLFGLITESGAATAQSTATQTSAYNYNYMYPFMNNQMRTDLNPGTTPQLNTNPINAVVRTEQYNPGNTRRVVARSASRTASGTTNTAARAATAATANRQTGTTRRVVARAATVPSSRTGTQNTNTKRRVVARSARGDTTVVTDAPRGDASYLTYAQQESANAPQSTRVSVPALRCMSDYIECMNGYCQRENTAYNRCYCSSKLSQIDATYQPAIENLTTQIIRLQGTNKWTDAEMNEYWAATIGKYTNDNSWVNIDNALNIDWASTESRVRGQQAFVTGHQYCVQHLQGCYYMAANLRDAYRTEIARDCKAYETNLQKIKNVAESVIEAIK